MTLPDEPVDQFKVTRWRVYTGNIRGIGPIVYEYHAHTQWEVYRPDDDHKGVPLHDDWMCYEFGHATGRIEGWSTLKKVLIEESKSNIERAFDTREEAATEFNRRARKAIDLARREAKAYEDAIENVRNGGTHDCYS